MDNDAAKGRSAMIETVSPARRFADAPEQRSFRLHVTFRAV
jgi:hypothetical protein